MPPMLSEQILPPQKPTQIVAFKATPLPLSRKMNIEQAFQTMAFNCLEQIEGNSNNIGQKYDIESLHQVRVGLRRFSCALGMFKQLISFPPALREELEWINKELGAARDWDVFAQSTLPTVINLLAQSHQVKPKSDTLNRSQMMGLAKSASLIENEKQKIASAALQSKRYALFVICTNTWIQKCEWRDAMSNKENNRLKQGIKKFAQKTMALRKDCLLRQGKMIDIHNRETLHHFRIASKKSRYVAEFFCALPHSQKIRKYIDRLTKIQEDLGWINDIEVAIHLSDELAIKNRRLCKNALLLRIKLETMLSDYNKKNGQLLRNIKQIKKIL
jgi:triphosphatase